MGRDDTSLENRAMEGEGQLVIRPDRPPPAPNGGADPEAEQLGLPVARYDRGFEGAGLEPFSDEIKAKLTAPIDPRLVEVRPDGIVYLPWVHIAARLTEAFGCGGWAIVPRDRPQRHGNLVIYPGALICHGRFIKEAWGECRFVESNKGMSYGDALEGAQSDCLTRCAKVFHIGKEMWDPGWREPFLAAACSMAWDEKNKTWLYWRNDRAKPWQVRESRPKPASDLPPDDPRVVAIRRAMRGDFDLQAVTELLNAEKSLEPRGEEIHARNVRGAQLHPDPEVVKGMTEADRREPTAEEIGELFPEADAPPPPRTRTRKPDKPPPPGKITAAQHRALEAAIVDYATAWQMDPKVARERLKNHMGKEFGIEHFPELTPAQYEEIVRVVLPRPRNGEGR